MGLSRCQCKVLRCQPLTDLGTCLGLAAERPMLLHRRLRRPIDATCVNRSFMYVGLKVRPLQVFAPNELSLGCQFPNTIATSLGQARSRALQFRRGREPMCSPSSICPVFTAG